MRTRSAAAPSAPQRLADEGARLLRLRGGGGASGADRPDRLVGDDDAGEVARLDRRQVGLQLALEHGLGLAGVARLLALADAEDRLQAGGQRRWAPCAPAPRRSRRSSGGARSGRG